MPKGIYTRKHNSKVSFICQLCGKVKDVKPSYAKRAKYCSKKCQCDAGQSIQTKEKCRLKALEQFKNGMPQKTRDKMRKHMIGKNAGEKNGMWKGEEYLGDGGRRWIWADGIKYAKARYVAMKCLGRELTQVEVVHHMNEDCSDDRPENLYLFATHGEHMRHHKMKNPPILTSNLINL